MNYVTSYKHFSWLIFFIAAVQTVLLATPKKTDLQPPHISTIWVNGTRFFCDSITNVPLSYGSNFFVAEINKPTNDSVSKIEYAYQLIGVDSNWVACGNQRKISYANLAPGKYKLLYKATADGHHWIEQATPISLVVAEPFWSVWRYHLLLVVVLIVLIWVLWKKKLNQAVTQALKNVSLHSKEASDLRFMMAQDFHDEMGNKLASIIVLVSTLQLLIKEESKEVKTALARIEKASKELFDGTKSFIWSINPQSDTLSEIVNYLNSFANELFDQTPTEIEIDDNLSASHKKTVFPVGYSRQLFFILKEALTNALVHAQASKVILKYRVDDTTKHLHISVIDNGNGLPKEHENSLRGLNNMKVRATKIDFQLSLQQNLFGGLTVSLKGELINK